MYKNSIELISEIPLHVQKENEREERQLYFQMLFDRSSDVDTNWPTLREQLAKLSQDSSIAGKSLDECLEAMCEAAKEGVEFTKTIRATKGRASYLGDRSIGHQDPGATSSLLTMEAIRDFCK